MISWGGADPGANGVGGARGGSRGARVSQGSSHRVWSVAALHFYKGTHVCVHMRVFAPSCERHHEPHWTCLSLPAQCPGHDGQASLPGMAVSFPGLSGKNVTDTGVWPHRDARRARTAVLWVQGSGMEVGDLLTAQPDSPIQLMTSEPPQPPLEPHAG